MVNISKAQSSTNIIEIVRNNRKLVFTPNLQNSSRRQGGEKKQTKKTKKTQHYTVNVNFTFSSIQYDSMDS